MKAAPVLDLVGAGHIINVHSDLVGDMRREFKCGRVGQLKNHSGPKLPVIQQLQCSVNQITLRCQPFQFVQRETLREWSKSSVIFSSTPGFQHEYECIDLKVF